MKNLSTSTLIVGALVVAVGLIIGGNVLSGDNAVPDSSGDLHGASISNNNQVAGDVENTPEAEVVLAPDFTLKNLEGEDVTLSSFRGEKPVILDFFATWCPNCQRDMPKLSEWYEEYKDQVEVIGINLQENQSKVEVFKDTRGIAFPIVMDPHGQASSAYGVRYTNYHVLIDIDGNVAGVVPGDISEEDILSLI